jgi:hypothetical protein
MATDVFAEQEAITFDLDGGAVESADEFYSGNRVSKEGYFHFACDGIERKQEDGKLDHLQIDLRVLDGNDNDGKRLEDQKDKTLVHRLFLEKWADKASGEKGPLEEKALKGLRAFAYAFGLISEEQLAQPNVRIPFHMIVGRQAVGKVQREDDWVDDDGKSRKGGLKVSWNNDFWPVTHERVKDVFKDREALSLLGFSGGGAGGSGGGVADSDLADI